MSARMPRTGRAEAVVPAAPEQVWTVLTDVTRIGEWSHECRTAQWLDGRDRAEIGARFRGSNKAGRARWSRPCTVTDLEAPHRFRYQTDGGLAGDCTQWTFTIEPEGAGSRVVSEYQILKLPRVVEWLVLKVVPQHQDRSDALRADLVRLGAVAAGEPADHRSAGRHQAR